MTSLYLDNAATSFPKPPEVYDAMVRYGTEVGASPGRGQYGASREGARRLREGREAVCTLIGGEDPTHVIYTLNTTDALNLAIKGVVRAWRRANPGATPRLVTTVMDHNSVLRPFQALGDDGAEVRVVPADPQTGLIDPADVAREINGRTALVAVNMASNVAGTIQPVGTMGEACRARGVPFLVDAAQALGHVSVDVRAMPIDLLAFPGHKGLLGPQGTGGLYIRPGIASRVETTREGGTGSWSESPRQPDSLPERFEAGSHNTIGIVGLAEAVRWITSRGVAALRAHELALIRRMLGGLREGGVRAPGWPGRGPLRAFRLLGPTQPEARVAVFSLVHDSLDAADLAAILESGFGVLARAGLTCAPLVHRLFESPGGALRLSFGPFVTEADVERALLALRGAGGEPAPREAAQPGAALPT